MFEMQINTYTFCVMYAIFNDQEKCFDNVLNSIRLG